MAIRLARLLDENRPVVDIVLRSKTTGGDTQVLALLDTGAQTSIFSGATCRELGLEVENGIKSEMTGVTGSSVDAYQHSIELEIDGKQLTLPIMFSDELFETIRTDSRGQEVFLRGIIGIQGFFDRYKTTFDLRNGQVTLT